MLHSFGPQSSPFGMENSKEVSDLYICLSLFVHSRIKCLSSYINHTCNTPCWASGGEEEVDTTWEKSYFEACIEVCPLTLILRRSHTGTVWFYTYTSNKRAARPKLYTKSLTRDLKPMYSRLTLVRISIIL